LQTLALLLPLILLLVTFLFLLVLLAVFLLILRRKRGIVLGDETGPTDVGTEHTALLTAEGGLEGVERRWLEEQDEDTRRSYQRAKGESSWSSAVGCFGRTVPGPGGREARSWPRRLQPGTRQTTRKQQLTYQFNSCSLSTAIPAQLAPNRHHSISIPLDPREGSLSLGV
jgi:hypothetical protein